MSKTLMILFMFLCTLTVQAGQRKEKVIVTLNDGTTVVGYEVNEEEKMLLLLLNYFNKQIMSSFHF